MFKYIGDSIINASFTVQVPKPLDSRTVVNNIAELYSIPSTYAYLGMTVANIDNGNIYMLVDKSKIDQKAGWRASYESIQIIACTEADYKTWLSNTDENFNPIDLSADYIHQDTYYYIYEDSLSAESELQEYVKRSDWMELLNVVSGKASNDGLARTNQIVESIIRDYATKQFVTDGYAPLSMFNLESAESFIRTNFFTKEEALGKFVKFSDLSGGEDIGEDDFIFVTASRYQLDQEALEQYKQGIADELADCLKVGDDGELDSITVGQIKSKKVNNEQLVIDVTPQGMSIDGDPIAKLSDVPEHITLTKEEYDALVENDQVNPDTYYHITGDDDTYVLQSELEENYYTKTGVGSYLASWTYSKAQVDEIISLLSFNTPEEIANTYVTKVALANTLEDYVTIAMLGGDDMEGQFIFVKASDYQTDQEALAQQRQTDLENLENNYIQKDSDASLNSLETETISHDGNTLTIADVIKFNNKNLALEEDVPVIQMVTLAEFEELTKDPNVYYFVYNTDESLAFVTAAELENYYTKTLVDSLLVGVRNDGFSGDYNDLTNKPTIPTIPTNVSVFVNDAGYLTQHQSLATLFDNVAYDSQTKRINFKHGETVLAYIDATDFIKDGMVSDVQIINGKLTISFNTDSGQSPIEIPITDIFNPNNYYTKEQVDTALQGKVDKSAIGDLGNISEAIPAVEPVEAQPAIYAFESFNNAAKEVKYGEGTVKVIEMRAGGATVEVVTNSTDQSFVGQQFNIATALATNDPIQLYTLENEPIDIWVTVELVSEAVEPVEGQEEVPAVPHTVKSYVDQVALGGIRLVKITQSAYTALQVKDPNTLYIVTED